MTENNATILLIDDDEIDREHVRRLIERRYRLIEACDGTAGLSAADAQRPNLLLLDYRLPDTDSFSILERFVAQNIPVVMLTGEESPEVIVSAMHLGASDYLLKEHITSDSLHMSIQKVLQHSMTPNAPILTDPSDEKPSKSEEEALDLVPENQLRSVGSALTLVEQRERKRIARMLHDHVQQLLYGAQMRLHLVMEDLPDDCDDELRSNTAAAQEFVEEAILAARTLVADLTPPIPSSEGISSALEWLARHMKHVHELTVELDIQADLKFDRDELHILVVQSVRELLFNVVKHANVKEALVEVRCEAGKYQITVQDEGVGFERGKVVRPKWEPTMGYGLYTIRERLKLFEGELDIVTHPNNGARITIVLPEETRAQSVN